MAWRESGVALGVVPWRGILPWIGLGRDVHTQVRKSNLLGMNFTDDKGQQQSVLEAVHANEGKKVKFGAGARSDGDKVGARSSAPVSDHPHEFPISSPSHECVSDTIFFLLSSSESLHIPQPSPDLRLSVLCKIYSNTVTKLIKPSKWGFLRSHRHFTGAIEDICTHAKAEDRFILQVTLPPPINTSLHCVAVRNLQICDPALPDKGWLPLTPASFACLGISAKRWLQDRVNYSTGCGEATFDGDVARRGEAWRGVGVAWHLLWCFGVA